MPSFYHTSLEWLLIWFPLVYGALTISHAFIQYWFAELHRRRIKSRHLGAAVSDATLLMPVFREDPDRLRACLQSLVDQTYSSQLTIVVVDDGSNPPPEVQEIYRHFDETYPNVYVYELVKNVGKRRAQHFAWQKHRGAAVYITVDSDTVLEPNAVEVLVSVFDSARQRVGGASPVMHRLGALTGYIGVSNVKKNVLTRVIGMRYWSAFNVERAAQSRFQAVMCCSGPLSAYLGSALEEVMDTYVSQRFRGVECTYGDDRHLTNLILANNYTASYEPRARAITHAPETLPAYMRQQKRWNMSFFREILWSFPALRKHHPYMTYDLTMQAALPLLLVFGLVLNVYAFSAGYPDVIWWYLVTVLAIGAIFSLYGTICTRNLGFMGFMFYGILHVTLLIPLRIYSFFSLLKGETSWGTR